MCVGLCINQVSLQSNKYLMKKSCTLLSVKGKIRSLGQVNEGQNSGPEINGERQTVAEAKFHGT